MKVEASIQIVVITPIWVVFVACTDAEVSAISGLTNLLTTHNGETAKYVTIMHIAMGVYNKFVFLSEPGN